MPSRLRKGEERRRKTARDTRKRRAARTCSARVQRNLASYRAHSNVSISAGRSRGKTFSDLKSKEVEKFTVSSRGACRTPWSRRRSSSAFCARPFCALRPRELASRLSVLRLYHHRQLLLHLPLDDERSPRRHFADHFAPRARSPPLDDAADLAFDSRRDRHSD